MSSSPFKIQTDTIKGAVINYDWEGCGSTSENSQKNFKPQPIQEIKIQTHQDFKK